MGHISRSLTSKALELTATQHDKITEGKSKSSCMLNSTFYKNHNVAAAKVIGNRGLITVGDMVKEKRTACPEVSERVKTEQESLWRW